MSGAFDRKPGGSSLVDAAGGGAGSDMAGPGKRTLAEQVGPPPAAGLTVPGVVRVKASDGLRVRRTPAKADNVVGSLPAHVQVEAHAREGDWLRIAHGGGTAFIHGGFVEPALPRQPHDVADSPPPMFHGPGGGAHVDVPPAHVDVPPAHLDAPPPAQPPTLAPPSGTGAATHAEAARPAIRSKGQSKDAAYDGRQLTDASYLKNYQHAAGGGSLYDNPTTLQEAAILNTVRQSQKRILPAYLLEWQTAVGVKNNSGAMNTDTLRKLVEHFGAPKVTAAAILSGDLFRDMAPDLTGKVIDNQGAGFGGGAPGSSALVPPGERADAMARAAGFPSYTAMHHFTDLSLLGFSLGQGLPHLAARVKLADAWLRQRHPNAVGNKAVCQQELNWSTRGNGAYSDQADLIGHYGFEGGVAVGPHMHSAGLALDIDAKLNPYVFAGDTNDKKDDNNNSMAKHLRWAAQIYGGERMTPDSLMQWSKDMATEELWARVQEVSQSVARYLQLAERGNDDEIFHAFADPPPKGAGMPESEARGNVMSVKHFGKKDSGDRNWKNGRFFQDQNGRKDATSLMQHSMDMLVALRDVAGLAWGGSEMSDIENGDFMHFDLRYDGGVGAAVYAFAQSNNKPPAKDDAKAAAPKAK